MPNLVPLRTISILKDFLIERFGKDIEVKQLGLAILILPRNYSELQDYVVNKLKFDVPEVEKELEREIERETEKEGIKEFELEG